MPGPFAPANFPRRKITARSYSRRIRIACGKMMIARTMMGTAQPISRGNASSNSMQTPDATGTAPTIAETLAKLGADDKTGLTDAEVQARLKNYGPNALVEKQKNTFAALLAYFWGPIPCLTC